MTINGEILMYKYTSGPFSFMFNDGAMYDTWGKKKYEKIYILRPSLFNLLEDTDILNTLNFHNVD